MNKVSFSSVYVLLAAMAMLPGCKNHVPGGASVPSGPGFGRTNGLLHFTSSAIDPDGNSVSIRFDWGDGFKSGWLEPVHSGDTVTGSHRWADEDTYLIRAQARDSRGAISDWSDPCSLRMMYNNWPAPPWLDDIGSVLAGEAVKFDVYVSDPDDDSVSLWIAWGDGDTTGWTDLLPSGEHVALYHKWADTGHYQILGRARDQYGMTSETDSMPIVVWRPRWRYKTGGSIENCPALGDDGNVYFGSDDGYVYALDRNGSLNWRLQTGAAVKSSPALAPDGTVYIGSNDGALYAISPGGALKWRYQTGDSIISSPALAADGTAYFGSYDGCLYAVDPGGALRWSFQTGGPLVSSPAVAGDGTIYAGSDDHYLYALGTSGVLKWRYDAGWCVRASPAIAADGTVYFKDLYAVDPNGMLKWRCPDAGHSDSPVVGADGTIYLGVAADWNGCLNAINPDGTVKWSEATGDIVSSVALAADGTLYVVVDGNLWAVDPSGDNWKWRCKIGAETKSPPTIGPDGTIYVGSDDGHMYAIQGDSPLADAPWPKFHHDARNTGRVGGR